jgi:AraC family transcriptional activator FtrA
MDNHLVVAVVPETAIGRQIGDMAALFAPPETQAAAYTGACPAACPDACPYLFEVCSLPAVLHTASNDGLPAPLALLERAGTIVLPAWPARAPPPAPLLDKLAAAHARGARLCAIGSGIFLLAAAGLLDGRRVAATRADADRLLRRHPDLDVRSGALFIDAGQLLTAAGPGDGMAMLLHLVRRDHGPAVADLAAQRLATASAAARDDHAVSAEDMTEDERFGQLLDWLREHPSQPHTLESMATHTAIAAASLQRRFLDATGLTPADWLRQERLALLRTLLETPPADRRRD